MTLDSINKIRYLLQEIIIKFDEEVINLNQDSKKATRKQKEDIKDNINLIKENITDYNTLLNSLTNYGFTTPVNLPRFMYFIFENGINDIEFILSAFKANATRENIEDNQVLIKEKQIAKLISTEECILAGKVKGTRYFIGEENKLEFIRLFIEYINAIYINMNPGKLVYIEKSVIESTGDIIDTVLEYCDFKFPITDINKIKHQPLDIPKKTINYIRNRIEKIIENCEAYRDEQEELLSKLEFIIDLADRAKINKKALIAREVSKLDNFSDGFEEVDLDIEASNIRGKLYRTESFISDLQQLKASLSTKKVDYPINLDMLSLLDLSFDNEMSKLFLHYILQNANKAFTFSLDYQDYLTQVSIANLFDENGYLKEPFDANLTKFIVLFNLFTQRFIYRQVDNEILLSNFNKELFISNQRIIVEYVKSTIHERNLIEERKNATKIVKEQPIKKEDPLLEYIVDGKIIKLCEKEQFEIILSKCDLKEAQKENYRRQMENYIRRLKEEEHERKINSIITSILNPKLLQAYERAITLNDETLNKEIKDIRDFAELYEKVKDESEKEEYADEIISIVVSINEYTKKIYDRETTEEETISNIIYYKDSNGIPLLEENIKDLEKSNQKIILTELTKLMSDNDSTSREVIGTSAPCKFYTKGRKAKLFYTKILDYFFVIGAFKEDTGYQELNSIVSRQGFEEQYFALKNVIENNEEIPNEIGYTETILELLDKDKKRNIKKEV